MRDNNLLNPCPHLDYVRNSTRPNVVSCCERNPIRLFCGIKTPDFSNIRPSHFVFGVRFSDWPIPAILSRPVGVVALQSPDSQVSRVAARRIVT